MERTLRWTAVAIAALALTGRAAAQNPLPPPGSGDWQPQTFPSVERPTHYQATTREGRRVWLARSECAASAQVLALQGVDLRRTPRLAWRWKLLEALDIPDERSRAGDDFAARVYVIFDFDASRASLMQRLRHRLGAEIFGSPLPGHSLNYVWASRVSPGTRWLSPYSEHSRLRALRSGPGGEWRTETVDLLADHRAWLGEPRTPPVALAVMTDSDDSCGRASALYADFRLLGPASNGRIR